MADPTQTKRSLVELKRMSQTQLIEYTLQLQERTVMQDDTTAWVSVDGSYGQDDIIVFHPTALTEDQWEFMVNAQAADRQSYVQAILEGDLETVVKFYEEYKVD